MLRYKRISSLFYTDTFFSKQVISKRCFSVVHLFVSDKGFVKVYGMKLAKEVINALKLFCKEALERQKRLLLTELRLRQARRPDNS